MASSGSERTESAGCPRWSRWLRMGATIHRGRAFGSFRASLVSARAASISRIPACGNAPSSLGLSGEGRSSATTLLVSTALEWMNGSNSGVPKEKRKLLGFTDNRQDAALQAGHFNDFLFVSLLRGAILRAVLDAGDDGMAEDEFGLRVVKALGFTAGNKDARIHWMLDPEAGAVVREDAQRSLAKVLAHRVWTDLRRGWRYTNPSLSVLKLIDVAFIGLDDIAEDTERLTAILPNFGDARRARAQGDAEAASRRHARRPGRRNGSARSDRPRRRRSKIPKSPACPLGHRRKGDAEKPHDPVSASSGQGPSGAAGRTDDHPRRTQFPYWSPHQSRRASSGQSSARRTT